MIGGVRAQFETCRRDCRSSNPVRGLESGLEEFEPSSRLVDGIVGVRTQFEACRRDCRMNREWRSSSQVRGLESEMDEFE